ncbi:MAG: 30S ribosomal protein S4, partial [Bacteroidota bacterium]
DRTIGKNLFGRSKSPVFKRPYKPGQHGLSKKNKKVSEYGEKILEAKKVRLFYGGLRNKDIKRIVRESVQKNGKSNNNIVKILESRLSSVVYRAKWSATPFGARQLISHGHVLVNDKKVDICSYRVKPGDKISLTTHMRENSHVIAATKSTERQIPEYIESKGFDVIFQEANMNNTTYPIEVNFNHLIEHFTR